MSDAFDIRQYIESRNAHGKEADCFEDAVKNVINGAFAGVKIEKVCLCENQDDSFALNIYGEFVI
jgi:hypothetical protein